MKPHLRKRGPAWICYIPGVVPFNPAYGTTPAMAFRMFMAGYYSLHAATKVVR